MNSHTEVTFKPSSFLLVIAARSVTNLNALRKSFTFKFLISHFWSRGTIMSPNNSQ